MAIDISSVRNSLNTSLVTDTLNALQEAEDALFLAAMEDMTILSNTEYEDLPLHMNRNWSSDVFKDDFFDKLTGKKDR